MKCRDVLRRLSLACLGIFSIISTAHQAMALQPDEIALVVNSNVPEGTELAQFYAQQRHIPDNRILVLDLPKEDQMTCKQYEDQVVPQVRDFLKSGHLETRVKCLVTFYGVPLRIDPRVNTVEEADELTMIRKRLMALPGDIAPEVMAVEKLAKQLNPDFVPDGGGDLEHLMRRREASFNAVITRITSITDQARRVELDTQFFDAAGKLLGDESRIRKLALHLLTQASTQPADQQALQQAQQQYVNVIRDCGLLEQMPNDAAARQQLRKIVSAHLGLSRYLLLLRDQADYLTPEQSGAAFDNELAMVGWNVYQHKQATMNPLYYGARRMVRPPTYMVCRLDAPQPETVRSIITTSIKVEQKGLQGMVVLDSLGAYPGKEQPSQHGYGTYDQTLRNLAKVLKEHSKLEVVLDEKAAVLPANSEKNVALYCGWYSLRNYIPCCAFNPGAVGFHIASYELISLRQPGETGWVHGLLNDGVVGTLGPVAEPYLSSFPRADDFFPLLLTGKLTFAEVFWKTEPTVSWMQACIGDPLYTPYRNNPQVNERDLPARLRAAIEPPPPTSMPASPAD